MDRTLGMQFKQELHDGECIIYLYDVQNVSYVVYVSLKGAKQATRTRNNDVTKTYRDVI